MTGARIGASERGARVPNSVEKKAWPAPGLNLGSLVAWLTGPTTVLFISVGDASCSSAIVAVGVSAAGGVPGGWAVPDIAELTTGSIREVRVSKALRGTTGGGLCSRGRS